MYDFDLSSVGKTNQRYSDAEEILIRQSMFQKEDAFARNEREIARLIEVDRILAADLVRYRIALSPQKHLPDEVLCRIFDIAAEEYGPLEFPNRRHKMPPQLVLSHVCSRWRMLALHTSVLFAECDVYAPLRYAWLDQARNPPVVSLLSRDPTTKIANRVQRVVSSLRIKILHLSLTFDQFTELSKSPAADTVLPAIEKLCLTLDSLTLGETLTTVSMLVRLRSVEFKFGYETGVPQRIPPMPWSQLQRLSFLRVREESLAPIVDILRQTPKLQEFQLRLIFTTRHHKLGPLNWKQVTMPALLKIDLEFNIANDEKIKKLLRTFTCPALVELELHSVDRPTWSCEIHGIIKKQYNMERLRTLLFTGYFPHPLSSILKDAPMLRMLKLPTGTIIDDEAITGVSSASLGRNLRSLIIYSFCNCVVKVLDMVEARKKMADELIEKGRNWRETVSILNYVAIVGRCHQNERQRIDALGKVGITVCDRI